jgi:hypothetical protein
VTTWEYLIVALPAFKTALADGHVAVLMKRHADTEPSA